MGFTFFDAIKEKIDDKELLKNIEKKAKAEKNESKKIWFQPNKKEGTDQNVLNYYRHQQKKEFDL